MMEHLEEDTNDLLLPLGRRERGLGGVNGYTTMENKKMSFDWSDFSTQYCSINIICPRRNSALQYPARPHEGPPAQQYLTTSGFPTQECCLSASVEPVKSGSPPRDETTLMIG